MESIAFDAHKPRRGARSIQISATGTSSWYYVVLGKKPKLGLLPKAIDTKEGSNEATCGPFVRFLVCFRVRNVL